jgi:hypothetical protein
LQFPIYWGDIFATIILASVLYLTFEEPIMIVEDYLYKNIKQNKKVNIKETTQLPTNQNEDSDKRN